MDGFPAKLIFTDAEVCLYTEWQKQIGTYDEHAGMIRGALELHCFLAWCELDASPSSDSGTLSQAPCWTGLHLLAAESKHGSTAPSCGHPLHPCNKDSTTRSLERKEGYCPVCLMRMCVNLQDTIAVAFGDDARRFRREHYEFEDEYEEWYTVMRRLWRFARLELANFKQAQEEKSSYEAEWESLNPTQTALVAGTYSSKLALELANQTITYPEFNASPHLSAAIFNKKDVDSKHEKPQETQPQKQVSFSPETNLEQNSDNARGRGSYCRSHRGYSPGAHASPSEHGWEDTSFLHNYAYNHKQTKIIKITPKEEEDSEWDQCPFDEMNPFVEMEALPECDERIQIDTEAAWSWVEQDPFYQRWAVDVENLYPGAFKQHGQGGYALVIVWDKEPPMGITNIYFAREAEDDDEEDDEKWEEQDAKEQKREEGQVGEITLPRSSSLRTSRWGNWALLSLIP